MRKTPVTQSLDLSGAPTAAFPRNVRPMLATSVAAPFRKDGWIFEIKWDGFRAISEIAGSSVRLQSRDGNDLNARFPGIIAPLAELGHEAVLDGELVVLDAQGVARFEWLQNYPRYGGQLTYYVFDLLHLDGRDLTGLPLLRRKQLLAQIVPAGSPYIRYCDHVEAEGESFFDAIRRRGLEGMIAKDGSSRYLPGRRSKRWLKVKLADRQVAVIAGYTNGEGARQDFGALVLGVSRAGTLVHIGEVGTGWSEATMQNILDQLRPLTQQNCPFEKRPKISRVHWVQPILQCEVKFHSWTRDGKLRAPVWLSLLESVRPAVTPPIASQRQTNVFRQTSETASIADRRLILTNLEKVYWPRDQVTKRELIAYYRDVAPVILRYLQDRPLSLHRFPDGVEGESFFQKNLDKAPDWIHTVSIGHASRAKPSNYALCQDEATLVYLANLGSIELHPWHSRTSKLEYPDYLVIDLDPIDTPFTQVVDAALAVRAKMEAAGGACWCKTSGMTGLHVYVPLGAKYDYGHASQFAGLVTRLVHRQLPGTTSLDRDPARRKNLIYLDSFQNRRGQSIASVYAPRAHPGALISVPLKWSEVNHKLDPTAFTIRTVGKRLSTLGDVWTGVMGKGIDMLDCLNRLQRLLQ